MAQVTKNTIHYILAYAAQGKHFPLTVNELQQLAYLAGRQLASPVKVGGDERGIPPMPENVLADMQVTIDRLKMWAKGEAYYAPVNGYDDPGVKKATISDVRKSAGYFAKRLEESYFALRDFMFAMDQARAALSADGGEDKRDAERYRTWRNGATSSECAFQEFFYKRSVDSVLPITAEMLDDWLDEYAAIAANQAKGGA